MSPRPVVPRARAARDIEQAIALYLQQGAQSAALKFIDAVEVAFHRLAHHPAAGSPRLGQELDLPGLRLLQVRKFPYGIFYVELPDRVDVWRVLHGRRDIPAGLQGLV